MREDDIPKKGRAPSHSWKKASPRTIIHPTHMDTSIDIHMDTSIDIHMDMSMDIHMEMPIKSKVSKLDGSCT